MARKNGFWELESVLVKANNKDSLFHSFVQLQFVAGAAPVRGGAPTFQNVVPTVTMLAGIARLNRQSGGRLSFFFLKKRVSRGPLLEIFLWLVRTSHGAAQRAAPLFLSRLPESVLACAFLCVQSLLFHCASFVDLLSSPLFLLKRNASEGVHCALKIRKGSKMTGTPFSILVCLR